MLYHYMLTHFDQTDAFAEWDMGVCTHWYSKRYNLVDRGDNKKLSIKEYVPYYVNDFLKNRNLSYRKYKQVEKSYISALTDITLMNDASLVPMQDTHVDGSPVEQKEVPLSRQKNIWKALLRGNFDGIVFQPNFLRVRAGSSTVVYITSSINLDSILNKYSSTGQFYYSYEDDGTLPRQDLTVLIPRLGGYRSD